MSLIEIALNANAGDGILQAVAPAAAERMQTAGAVGMPAAALTLIVAGERRTAARRDTHQARLVHPFPAQAELVLRCIHGEREALPRGFAPHASTELVQALHAVGALSARNWALI